MSRAPAPPAHAGPGTSDPDERPRRGPAALAARVLAVQAATLLALWLLQAAFGGG